jgi:hypothetical protein
MVELGQSADTGSRTRALRREIRGDSPSQDPEQTGCWSTSTPPRSEATTSTCASSTPRPTTCTWRTRPHHCGVRHGTTRVFGAWWPTGCVVDAVGVVACGALVLVASVRCRDVVGGGSVYPARRRPGDKLEVYRELGLKLNYNHETEEVTAETNPRPNVGDWLCPEGVSTSTPTSCNTENCWSSANSGGGDGSGPVYAGSCPGRAL